MSVNEPQEGADMEANENKTLEERVKELEETCNELIGILKTAGGKLRALPPEASPLDAHKIIIEAGGSLANIKVGKKK